MAFSSINNGDGAHVNEDVHRVGRERGVWKDRPRHDDALHGADAFLTFACAATSHPPPSRLGSGPSAGSCDRDAQTGRKPAYGEIGPARRAF